MKKYFIITALLFCSKISAQTNLDLENWAPENGIESPTGWSTMNLFAALEGDSVACFKTSDAYKGNYAAKVRPIYVPTSSTTGYDIPATLIQEVAYSGRPKSFRFAYKFNSAIRDTAAAAVYFFKGNTNDTNNLIGVAELMLDTTSKWKYAFLDITWKSVVNPDTVVIGFSSGLNDKKSWLYLDDITLSNYGVGTQPIAAKDEAIKITSNGTILCSDILSKSKNTMHIYNTAGSLVGCVNLQGKNQVPENLSGGLYYYTIVDEENGTAVTQGKFFLEPR